MIPEMPFTEDNFIIWSYEFFFLLWSFLTTEVLAEIKGNGCQNNMYIRKTYLLKYVMFHLVF